MQEQKWDMVDIIIENKIRIKGNTITAKLDTNGVMILNKDNTGGENYKSVKPFIHKHKRNISEEEIHFLVAFETLAKNLLLIHHKEHKKIQELLKL